MKNMIKLPQKETALQVDNFPAKFSDTTKIEISVDCGENSKKMKKCIALIRKSGIDEHRLSDTVEHP